MKENTLESLVKGVKGKDLDKFMLVYSRIAHRVSYDLNYIDKEEPEKNIIVLESELENGKTTSTGYSEILNKCLEKVGVESKCINGNLEEKKHTWNQVKLDSKWYNTDLTLDRENIMEDKKLDYTLKSNQDFNMHTANTLEMENCKESLPQEILSNYEYILKYETNNLFQIIDNVEQKTNDNTVITYNEDIGEMLLVNETGIKDVPTTKEQFFSIMDKKDEKKQVYVLENLRQEYENAKDREVQVENTLPVPYEEGKIFNFISRLTNKFVDKFFSKKETKAKKEEKRVSSNSNMFNEINHKGYLKEDNKRKSVSKEKQVEEEIR